MTKRNRVKSVLVTGGAGYIGSVLSKKLVQKGFRVRVLDKFIFGNDTLDEIKDKIEIINTDIRRIKSSFLDNIDAIIHLAGFSTEPTSQYDPRLTDMINHIATENLAKISRAKGIKRFVYASTCSIYFTLNTPLTPPLYKETDIVNPISSYSLTKRCSEQVLWGMTSKDFQPTIFRKGTVYGLSPRMRYDLVFNSFAKDAYFKKRLTVDAGGEIWRPMIDIEDVTEIYIKSLESAINKVGGKIFNIVDKNWKVGDLAKEIKKIAKKRKRIEVELDVKPYGITRNYKADNSYFKKIFNFKPQRNIEKALLEIFDYFERNKDHDPYHPKHYGDVWYKQFFESKKGKLFKKYV